MSGEPRPKRSAKTAGAPEEQKSPPADDAPNSPTPLAGPSVQGGRRSKPPIAWAALIVATIAAATSAYAAFRGGGATTPGSSPSDPNHTAHAALVGAWTCGPKKESSITYSATLVLLDAGRYTLQRHAFAESYMKPESTTGTWEIHGRRLLFTVDSCVEYDGVTNKAVTCLPTQTLHELIHLPVEDTIELSGICSTFKRVGERD